jgi:gamma-glutamyl-gamma-aminobutyrate hydrolase PuuD
MELAMKPRIAITGEECVEPSRGLQLFVLSRQYAAAVSRSGGLPFMPADVRLAEEYGDIADALILTAGPPVHRSRHGGYYRSSEEMAGVSITRDEFEFSLFYAVSRRNKPVLGIGRGMDIINIALGGGPERLAPDLRPWALSNTLTGFEKPGAHLYGVPWQGEQEKAILHDVISYFLKRSFPLNQSS